MAPSGGQQCGQGENLLEELQPPSHPTATTGGDRGTRREEAMASVQRMRATAVELFFDFFLRSENYFLPLFSWDFYDLPSFTLSLIICPILL
jgi:hypothetical protein